MSSSALTPMERLIQSKFKKRPPPREQNHESDDECSDDSCSSVSVDNHRESQSEYKKGGYHPVVIGDRYNEKYIIEKKLGFGYFSTVWLASDQTRHDQDPLKLVAIKISKSRDSFQEAAQDELKLLQTLGAHEFTVQLLDQFILWGPNGKHYCLVFEPMWKDLFFLIRKFNYKGLPLKLLKAISYQVLCGVEHLHEKQIIHTDIKPENFLMSLPYDLSYATLKQERELYLQLKSQLKALQRQMAPSHTLSRNQRKRRKEKAMGSSGLPTPSELNSSTQPTQLPNAAQMDQRTTMDQTLNVASTIEDIKHQMMQLEKIQMPNELNRSKNLIVKVADLGNACWTNKHISSNITTRQYRSPEVLLGYPYGSGVDLFSCGAMFFELATGEFLFQPQKVKDANYRNENHLALIFRTAGYLPQFMIKEGKYSNHYFNRRCEFRRHSVDSLEPRSLEDLLRHYNYKSDDISLFSDFLRKLIEPDPAKRWSATQAKQHPWLADVHSEFLSRGLNAFSLN